MVLDNFRLDGKIALVTGSGQGIGRAIALTFAEAGASVICADLPTGHGADTVSAIQSAGGDALSLHADVTKADDIRRLSESAYARYGQIDILVNNAGGSEFKPFLEIDEALFKRHLDLNTVSAFLVSQTLARSMLAAGSGAILNISSGAAHFGIRGMTPYCVAKAAVEHLTRSMAQELAPKLRVNCMALGSTMTPALEDIARSDPDFLRKMEEKTPMHRIARPEEIALGALFLCSPAASYITGAVLNIDGGLQDTNMPFRLPDL